MYLSALAAYNPSVSSAAAAFAQPLFSSQQPVSSSSPSYQAQISDYGRIQNTLAELQAAAHSLSGPQSFSAVTANESVPAALNLAKNYAASAGSQGGMQPNPGAAAQITKDVQTLIAAYNKTLTKISQFQQGDLAGDATLNLIRTRLSSVLAPQKNALLKIGINSNADGTLTLNPQTLRNALAEDATAVAKLFGDIGAGLADLNATSEPGPGAKLAQYRAVEHA